MNESLYALLLEVAGFLNLVSQGIHPPNEAKQASDLLVKIGDALAEPPATDAPETK